MSKKDIKKLPNMDFFLRLRKCALVWTLELQQG